MPFTLTMPKLSPTMEEGMLVKWHKGVGELVEAGDLLIEVATDKATVEFNALDRGWLRRILVTEGKSAVVNQAIAIMSLEQEESLESYQPEGYQPESANLKSEEKNKIESQLETTSSTESGSLSTSQPNSPQLNLVKASFVPEKPLENYNFDKSSTKISLASPEERLRSSPLARKLAKEKGLDLTTVKGSGPDGRIMSHDLVQAKSLSRASSTDRPMPTYQPGDYIEESLTPMRKTIAQRLQEAKTFIPHFYVSQVINAYPLVTIREQLRVLDIKVTYNDLILRACALTLREHPQVNSGFNSTNNTLIRFKTIDIAVAVSLPEGLITPIIRHADFKTIGELSVEIRELARRAKEGKLELQEYKGGSFTISNLGMYGVTDFGAIINPPQAAILAISGIQEAPVIFQGAIVPGKVLNLTLSADHRVIDGVAGAEFLRTLQKYLENPAALLI